MDFKHLNTSKNKVKAKDGFVKWKPSTVGYKLNTDGALSTATNISGLGGVIRDKEGNYFMGFMGNSPQGDNVLAEIQVLW